MMRWLLAVILLAVFAVFPAQAQTPSASSVDDNPASYLVGRYKQTVPASTDPIPVDVKTEGTNTVTFAALHDDWRGHLESGGEDKPDHLILTRKPSASDLNSEIPDWARTMVAGQVEWRLELDVHECAPDGLTLDGVWYPGEIAWTDAADPSQRKARVAGPGKPVNVTYVFADKKDVDWNTSSGRPDLRVAPASAPLAKDSIAKVTLGDGFFLSVRVNPDMAQSLGNQIAVTLAGQKSGRSAQVQLQRFGSATATPVIYTTGQATVLGEPFMNLDKYIDLHLDNGENVIASYGDTKVAFKYYKSWVQLGISTYEDGFTKLNTVYEAIMRDGKQTAQTREAAHQKMLLIANARALMAHQAAADEKFTDYSRYAIGQEYTTLLMSPSTGRKFAQPVAQWGAVLTTSDEVDALQRALAFGVDKWNAALANVAKELTLGLYDFVANATGANQFFMVVWGLDAHGNRVDMTDRVFAGIGLGSQLLLVGATTAQGLQQLQSSSLEFEHQVAISDWHDQQLGAWDIEASVRDGASPALGAGTAANFGEVKAGSVAAFDPNKPPFRQLDANETDFEAPQPAQPMGSKGTPLQLADNSCGVATAEGMVRDAGFPAVQEKEAIVDAFNGGHWKPGLMELGGGPTTGGGMSTSGMKAYLEEFGAEVKAADFRNFTNAQKLRGLQNQLQQNRQVAVMVNAGTSARQGYHWLRVEGFTCGKNSRLYVNIGDPWTGRSWTIRSNLLAKRIVSGVSADFSQVTTFVR